MGNEKGNQDITRKNKKQNKNAYSNTKYLILIVLLSLPSAQGMDQQQPATQSPIAIQTSQHTTSSPLSFSPIGRGTCSSTSPLLKLFQQHTQTSQQGFQDLATASMLPDTEQGGNSSAEGVSDQNDGHNDGQEPGKNFTRSAIEVSKRKKKKRKKKKKKKRKLISSSSDSENESSNGSENIRKKPKIDNSDHLGRDVSADDSENRKNENVREDVYNIEQLVMYDDGDQQWFATILEIQTNNQGHKKYRLKVDGNHHLEFFITTDESKIDKHLPADVGSIARIKKLRAMEPGCFLVGSGTT